MLVDINKLQVMLLSGTLEHGIKKYNTNEGV